MMEFVESSLTSKFQLTLPKIVREQLGIRKNDQVVFLIEDQNVRVIKKPEDLIAAMDNLAEGKRFTGLIKELRKSRNEW